MSTWLDTETKALLQQVPPEKLAPPDTGKFTLVILDRKREANWRRVAQVLMQIPGISPMKAILLSTCMLKPIVSGLSLPEALLWQFELICCDAISVFVRDEIASSPDREHYLPQLRGQLLGSPEFSSVQVTVSAIPDNETGKRFVAQFLHGREGMLYRLRGVRYTFSGDMIRKKARIMAHWADKIGATVVIADDN
jgi:hypothetical protein